MIFFLPVLWDQFYVKEEVVSQIFELFWPTYSKRSLKVPHDTRNNFKIILIAAHADPAAELPKEPAKQGKLVLCKQR